MKRFNNVYSFLPVVISLFIFTSNMACDVLTDQGTSESRDIIKQEREVGHFHKISIGGALNVVLIQGQKEMVVVEAGEDMLNKIITEVEKEHLSINTRAIVQNIGYVKITVYFRNLESIDIRGASQVSSGSTMKYSGINIIISGSSIVNFDLVAESLNCILSGASNFTIQGKSDNAKIEISGASILNALAIEIGDATIEVSGASNATVNATRSLIVDVSGGSVVKYKEGPPVFKSQVRGGGSLKKI